MWLCWSTWHWVDFSHRNVDLPDTCKACPVPGCGCACAAAGSAVSSPAVDGAVQLCVQWPSCRWGGQCILLGRCPDPRHSAFSELQLGVYKSFRPGKTKKMLVKFKQNWASLHAVGRVFGACRFAFDSWRDFMLRSILEWWHSRPGL